MEKSVGDDKKMQFFCIFFALVDVQLRGEEPLLKKDYI